MVCWVRGSHASLSLPTVLRTCRLARLLLPPQPFETAPSSSCETEFGGLQSRWTSELDRWCSAEWGGEEREREKREKRREREKREKREREERREIKARREAPKRDTSLFLQGGQPKSIFLVSTWGKGESLQVCSCLCATLSLGASSLARPLLCFRTRCRGFGCELVRLDNLVFKVRNELIGDGLPFQALSRVDDALPLSIPGNRMAWSLNDEQAMWTRDNLTDQLRRLRLDLPHLAGSGATHDQAYSILERAKRPLFKDGLLQRLGKLLMLFRTQKPLVVSSVLLVSSVRRAPVSLWARLGSPFACSKRLVSATMRTNSDEWTVGVLPSCHQT